VAHASKYEFPVAASTVPRALPPDYYKRETILSKGISFAFVS
jgi:hypothetical protein